MMRFWQGLPLTAVEDFGKSNSAAGSALQAIVEKHGGLWSLEAEQYLLAHGENIE